MNHFRNREIYIKMRVRHRLMTHPLFVIFILLFAYLASSRDRASLWHG